MHICLVSQFYPPRGTEGIARQRQALAASLAKMGHEVHIITQGLQDRVRNDNGVLVHEIPTPDRSNPFSSRFPDLDDPLTYSQAVYESLIRLDWETPIDIVDVPLWMAEGLVTLEYYPGPVMVWLQTTLLQQVELQDRRPTPQEAALARLEKECLCRAAAVIADSESILTEVERVYGFSRETKPTRVIPLGLPPLPETCQPEIPRPDRPFVEALVVGRLEVRKGTKVLFDILPEVLRQEPRLKVRFVGRDNSLGDGFQKRTGMSYPEYFRQRYPDLSDRVIFEGYVSDERLSACYLEADFHLLPSLYESFGLVFLESMRCGLPAITFSVGGACEIFREEEDGAILIPVGDSRRLSDAILELTRNRDIRAELGRRALARFSSSFHDSRMAQDTADFYAHVCQVHRPPRRELRAGRVLQVMEALDYGDAVSNIARRNAQVLAELGGEPAILSLYAEPRVASETKRLKASVVRFDDALIYHYWNYSHLEGFLRVFRGPKAVHYHNITPPHYFSPHSSNFRSTTMGYDQIKRIAGWFDLIVGDSNYNLTEYAKFLSRPKPTICIHPIVEVEALLSAPFDEALYRQLREAGWVNFLFVGRVARNKRQDQIIRVFDYYYREINRYSRLFLIGSVENDPEYFQEVEELRRGMVSHEQIVFTGKVPDEALRGYYRAADVFVCASEHEGFCVPLVEALAYGIPVVAFDAAAVPETLGRSGVLIHQWDVERVAELINLLLKDKAWRTSLIEHQRENLWRFSEEEIRPRLAAVVEFLGEGKESPLFVWRGPDGAKTQ